MAVNWSLGAPTVDIGAQFQAGMDRGRQVLAYQNRQNALRAYAANPNDPNAQNALLVADPATALQFRDQRLQEQQAQHQQALQAMNEHRDRIIYGAQFLRNVNDEASYQQALGLARQSGMDLTDVPQHYDPGYVRNILSAAQYLQAAEHPMAPPEIARDVSYYQSIGRPDLANQALVRHAEGPPSVASNGDGTFTILPPQMTHPQSAPQTATNPQTGQRIQYNPQTGQWEPIQGGAGQPQAQGTFPRADGGAFDFNAHPTRR